MDNNNPNDSNSSGPGVPDLTLANSVQPASPASIPPVTAPTPIEILPGTDTAEGRILTDVTSNLPSQMTSSPPASSPETSSPDVFNLSPNQPPAQPEAPVWGSGTNTLVQQPGTTTPQTAFDQPQSPLPDANSIAGSSVPSDPPNDSVANNPFLQPNAGSAFSMPQASSTEQPTNPLPNANSFATAATSATPTAPAFPNPMTSQPPDPLNTAFSPAAAGDSSFGSVNQDIIHDQTIPAQESQVPAVPTSPTSGSPATNPWDLPPMPPGTQQPADAIDPSSVTHPQNPTQMAANQLLIDPLGPTNPTIAINQPGASPTNNASRTPQPGQIPEGEQSGPLDLSALTSTAPTNPDQTTPDSGTGTEMANQTPGVGAANTQNPGPLPQVPTENAPTDLSHLLAGEEQGVQNGVYTPPIAKDQNPAVTSIQPQPTTEGDTPPPGKHLNLTKVLLVAGIPIILIVAALSAYLIMGVGKQAAPEDTTSLPVEQTTQTQAPLTNPPQQIVAPSPVSIPEPSAGLPSSSSPPASATASASPAASLSPAMQAAQRQASPSPSAAGVQASPSPASSASTSLPLN